MSNKKIIIGNRYGMWTVLKHIPRNTTHTTMYKCRCDCGVEKDLLSHRLLYTSKQNFLQNCGCLRNLCNRLKPYEALYKSFLRQCKRRNKENTLSYEDFLMFTKETRCHYCGDLLPWKEYTLKHETKSYLLDRKDNSKGYTKENCVVCCSICNRTKMDTFSYEEFTKLGWIISLIKTLRTGNLISESSGQIRTYTGEMYNFLNPNLESINIMDIAHALAYQCRFVGMTYTFYSVAEHCVRVSDLCPTEHKLWGLMHDAGEAYCADISRPFKRMPGMAVYRFYEKIASRIICKKFGLNIDEPAEVKQADMRMLVTEQRDLMNNALPDFSVLPVDEKIVPWCAEEAEQRFLTRFVELTES